MKKVHIFFIGMMGTGKTTVGKLLAERIRYPWIDMDQQLEIRFKQPISSYFSQYGETAFRRAESKYLKEIVHYPPAVITTGGGIVLKKENRMLMSQYGRVISLSAHPDEIIRRLSDDQSRPLLKGDLEEKVKQLIKEREKFYQFAEATFDTTNQTIGSIVEEVYRYLFNSPPHR